MSGYNKRTYRARARRDGENEPGAWTLGRSSTGKEQIAVGFEILTEGVPENEKFLTWYGYFTDQTFERTIESLRYMGWKGEDLTELLDGGANLDECEVDLVVEDEEHEGRTQVKVQWVNRAGGGGVALKDRLGADEARVFAASMKDRIRAMAAANGQRPAQQRQTASAGSRAAPPARPATNGNGRSAPAGRAVTRQQSAPPEWAEPPPLTDDDIPF